MKSPEYSPFYTLLRTLSHLRTPEALLSVTMYTYAVQTSEIVISMIVEHF